MQVVLQANVERELIGVLTRRAHQLEQTQYLEVGQLRTTKKKLDAKNGDAYILRVALAKGVKKRQLFWV